MFNEDGTILSRKFLKLSENVRSGSTFELPKYLVEVGEPRIGPEGNFLLQQRHRVALITVLHYQLSVVIKHLYYMYYREFYSFTSLLFLFRGPNLPL